MKYVKCEVEEKGNGNIRIYAICPFCGYVNVIVSDFSPLFPVPPDVCKHFQELIWDSDMPVEVAFKL